jgi:hypothetical protein
METDMEEEPRKPLGTSPLSSPRENPYHEWYNGEARQAGVDNGEPRQAGVVKSDLVNSHV